MSAKIRRNFQIKTGKRYDSFIVEYILLGKRKRVAAALDSLSDAFNVEVHTVTPNLSVNQSERFMLLNNCEPNHTRKFILQTSGHRVCK